MRKNDAEKLIGKLVITDYINGAKYIGELVEIIPTKPFRCNVKIYAVNSYPWLYEHHSKGGFIESRISFDDSILKPKGEIVNTGNDIQPYLNVLPSYKESIIIALEEYMSKVKNILEKYRENDGNYHSYYIRSMKDSQNLYDLLNEQLLKAKDVL